MSRTRFNLVERLTSLKLVLQCLHETARGLPNLRSRRSLQELRAQSSSLETVGRELFSDFSSSRLLPQLIADEMRAEREEWRQRLARELTQHDGTLSPLTEEEYEAFQLRTARRLERLMDEGHGECVLKQAPLREIVASALLHFQGERYAMYGFVVMPNHVHLAVKPLAEWQQEELLHYGKDFPHGRLTSVWAEKGSSGSTTLGIASSATMCIGNASCSISRTPPLARSSGADRARYGLILGCGRMIA